MPDSSIRPGGGKLRPVMLVGTIFLFGSIIPGFVMLFCGGRYPGIIGPGGCGKPPGILSGGFSGVAIPWPGSRSGAFPGPEFRGAGSSTLPSIVLSGIAVSG